MPRSKPGFTLVELLVVIGIILVLACLMLPFQRDGREAARRNQCLNQLKQIALGIHNYNDAQGHLPPEFSADESNRPLHSWRALLLPYLEESQLTEQIDHQQPWDAVVNDKVRTAGLPIYLCPSYPGEELTSTTYRGCAGPEYLFNGSSPRLLADILDGTSSTVMIVDEPAGQAIEWMSPVEATAVLVNSAENKTEHSEAWLNSSVHFGVKLAAYADGHSKPIKVDLAPEAFHALKTIAGNEKLDDD